MKDHMNIVLMMLHAHPMPIQYPLPRQASTTQLTPPLTECRGFKFCLIFQSIEQENATGVFHSRTEPVPY